MCEVIECTCTFVEAGKPMDNFNCKVHTKGQYKCDICSGSCLNYRPQKPPVRRTLGSGFIWARCVCGHFAQDHN